MAWAVIGIDGGLHGAVVAIDQNMRVLGCFDMPTLPVTKRRKGGKKIHANVFDASALHEKLHAMVNVLHKHGYAVAMVLERAQAMPGQGVSSMFTTGRGYGLAEMAAVSTGKPYQLVSANVWTKEVLKGCPGEAKERSLLQASRLFPRLTLTKPNGKKLSLDGRADAALLAYYGLKNVVPGEDHG